MEIFSVALLVLSGVAISSAYERLWLGLRYDLMAVASVVVVFGCIVFVLTVFRLLGLWGVFLTFFTAILLHPVFIGFNLQNNPNICSDQNIWGRFYWAIFLIIFTIAGLKSWIISNHIRNVYSLGSDDLSFYVTFGLFVVAGGVSLLMTIHQIRDRNDQQA